MAAQPLPDHSNLRSSRAGVASGARRRRGGDRAVESMASRVARPCQRNDCPAPARAGVELSSVDKVAVLVDLVAVRDPRRMELCAVHAGSVTVPRGWSLVDERAQDEEPQVPTGPPSVAELGRRSTLELLTAALESDTADTSDEGPSEDGEATVGGEVDDDGPSVAAVMAAVLARPTEVGDLDEADGGLAGDVSGVREQGAADDLDGDVVEDVVEGGTQLALAAVQPDRRPRPVPAARD